MYSWEDINTKQAKISIESHGESVYVAVNETILEGDQQARWFWELLQNAKDAIEDEQLVNVQLIIRENEVIFQHDGTPFDLDEILKLITQGSSKKGKAGKTGRFGTGFISTYILSKQVRIQGSLEDSTSFDFLLDREASSAPHFLIKQQESTQNFFNSFGADNRGDLGLFTTSFTYTLSETGKLASTAGMDEISDYLPYVLAFNPKFKKITVDLNGTNMSYEKDEPIFHALIPDQLIEIPVHLTKGEKSETQALIKVVKDKWEAAFKVEQNGGQRNFMPIGKQTPNLFASFPLLGTEVLGLPFAIHSAGFGIKHERNGVFLGSGNSDVIIENKEIVEQAVGFLPMILRWSVENYVGKRFNVITFFHKTTPKWLDADWIVRIKSEAILTILNIPIVTTERPASGPICVNKLIIPGEDAPITRNKMLTLLKDIEPSRIPVENEAENWYEFAINTDLFSAGDEAASSHRFFIPNLCELVAAMGSQTSLQNSLGSTSAFIWLNDFYRLVAESDLSLFHKYAIVPVQNDHLIAINAATKTDQIEEPILYQVSALLGDDLLPSLVMHGISLPSGLCNEYTREELINKLIAGNVNQPAADFIRPNIINANALLLKWLIIDNRFSLLSAFQVITAGEDQSRNLVHHKYPLGAFVDKKHKLLAPKLNWSDNYRLFAELVRDRDCLHPVYATELSADELNYLSEQEFIHLLPLISGKMAVTRAIIPQILRDANQETLLFDDEGNLKIEEIAYTDFTFFTTTEGQILANNNSAQSSIDLLRFAIEEGVERDAEYNSFYTLQVDPKNQIEFRKALWVGRLKNNRWINVRNFSSESAQAYFAEKPSSQNLAGLINSAQDLKQLIRTPKGTAFLNLLGVSVSDLLRNTLGSDAEKHAWEKAFTALLSANLDPVLAETMLNDPNLQNEYRKRKLNTELIHRNQKIGYLLETEFKKLFEREKYQHLHIERKPFGSDYIISPESSDLVDDNREEIIFQVGAWYLELKATGRDYAAMTRLQAQRAVDNPLCYALVVLPLGDYEITGDNILEHAKFVCNIGDILLSKHTEVATLKAQQAIVGLPSEEVQVAIDEEDIRFHIRKSAWESGEACKMEEFLGLVGPQI